jgi:hypothetical protein
LTEFRINTEAKKKKKEQLNTQDGNKQWKVSERQATWPRGQEQHAGQVE